MAKGNVRDNVEMLLEKFPKTRDSDKLLLIMYWQRVDRVRMNKKYISTSDYINKATSAESITRARRLVQSEREELQPSVAVKEARRKKESMMRSGVIV